MLRQQGAGDSILLKGKTTTRVLVRVCLHLLEAE